MTSWAPVVGYEGLYQVSNEGQINTMSRRGEWMPRALATDKNGYKRITLSKNGKKRCHLVHHLVLDAFVGPRMDGQECRHLNGDPGDNRLENLQWGTSTENSFDVVRHGNHHGARKTHCKHGHEFTPDNTMEHVRGGRQCRTCNRERATAWYAAKHGAPRQGPKTHCKRGHEFTPENTMRRRDGRECRACIKVRYIEKRRAA